MDDGDSLSEAPARKRVRTSHACDVCRSRKIRCDGKTPCASCAQTENACTYGSEANPRGKSDLILEGVLRVEKYLHQLNTKLASPHFSDPSRTLISPGLDASTVRGSFSCSPLTEAHPGPVPGSGHHDYHNRHRTPVESEPQDSVTVLSRDRERARDNFENAVLDSMHTSTTESVLQWPHFDVFPSLRYDYVSIFQLERMRLPLRACSNTLVPYITTAETDDVLASFERTVNFWYPTISRKQLKRTRGLVVAGITDDDSTHTCLALLIMALGCASQAIEGLSAGGALSEDDLKRRAGRRAMADMYFDAVLRRLHVIHTDMSPIATHCLFFIAMYFAFLRRPLQAWEYIHSAAAKCLLLLSYPPAPSPAQPDGSDTAEDDERIRRIFWACYVLESDYLAELAHLPVSGIARIESSVPLPAASYHTHNDPQTEEQSNLYFLACISMRRLLNRVHQLLYARDSGASLDRTRFPSVVAELDHQLEEWRDVLPVAFAFRVGFDGKGGGGPPTETEHGGFLRQRYLTCRSVIYRPYLMWMLSGCEAGTRFGDAGRDLSSSEVELDRQGLANCKACLDACLLHILNLRGFAHTVFVDTWICSLSMAGAMLVLLAACRVPSLRGLIGPEVLLAGNHLRRLLDGWQRVSGDPFSPSVVQSTRIITEADQFISEVYGPDNALLLMRRMSTQSLYIKGE